MPKILINEKDITTPGNPGNYANYAVLIAGYEGEVSDPILLADGNGAYEFKSAQTFKDSVGLVAPDIQASFADGSIHFQHYGNQMAYELLKLGYPIIYKSLGNVQKDYKSPKEIVDKLISQDVWEPFKDKASYDFRFVTHGLLSSSDLTADESARLDEARTVYDAAKAAMDVLNSIAAEAEEKAKDTETNPDFEESLFKEEEYALVRETYPGFIGEDGKPYTSYTLAYTGVEETMTEANRTITNITYSNITGGHINTVNGHIANLANYVALENPTNKSVVGRGDCIALIELNEREYTVPREDLVRPEDLIIDGINKMSEITSENGKYCALTVPSVHYKMSVDANNPNEFNNNVKFPGAFHYLACFLNSVRLGFAEWYAAAGYTRGVAGYIIDHTTVKLGEIAINALEPRNIIDQAKDPKFACNVIANFRGSYYLWGNRTAHPLGKQGNLETGDLVASSFLNIRQLCTTIKKQLYVSCRTFTFDPNSDSLWINFVNSIRPTLEAMKADQGIRDYKILKVPNDSTKATLKAKIRIIPIEAVEDFDLEISLEDSFGETTAEVNE